jgi:outer membrane receptor protein involved in Fe transport
MFMRKLIVMLILVAMFAPVSIFASIYGVLAGKVVDAEGKGIIGASVFITGTTRGTNVKARDGSFTVTNITAGNYTVRVRAVGKTEKNVNVRISADQTTNINVELKDESVALDSIVVTATSISAKKVDENSVGSISTMSNEELTRSTGSSIADVVGQSAGVSSGSDGYSIRGSRSSETQIRLDGLNMGDQFSGGFGAAGAAYFPMVSTYATEEVQVITGNFSAQYGDAQGGVINSVMRTGRTDKYEGYLEFKSDIVAGYQGNSTNLIHENGKYKLVDGDGGAQYLMRNKKDISLGFGGPLGFINDRTTFYLTIANIFAPDNSGYDLHYVDGTSAVRSPISGTQSKNFEGRLNFGLTNDIKLVLGGKYGLVNNISTNFRFADVEATPYIDTLTGNIDPINGTPVANGIFQAAGKATALNQFVENAFARLNHTLTDRSYYEFTVAWGANNQEQARRVAGTELNYFTGYQLMQPEDNWIVDADKWSQSAIIGGRNVGDKIIDWASPVSSIGMSKDNACSGTWTRINPLTGFYEGEMYSQATDNPYGRQGFNYAGGASGFSYQYSNFIQADGNYNLFGVETGKFKHTVKAGFEATYMTMNRHYNGNPYSGSPTYDIYTDKWGGNIYAENDVVYNKTSEPKNEFKLGMYVQDQITYKGIVFNPGIRLDVLDPMSQYRILTPEHPQFIPISSETGFEDASVKIRVSPRININYPITEASYISLSYGQFFQSPAANYLYYFFNMEQMQAGSMVGDPNMEAQQTNQYQVSYQNQLTEELALSVSAYYKDIYNQLGVNTIMTVPDAYYQYAVSEYGSSKGLEVKVDKYLSNYFGLSLNYALAYLTVTATDETSNSSVLLDPYTGKLTFPLAPYYSSNDMRHLVKGNLYFFLGNDEGPTLFNMKPLQNLLISFGPYWHSGTPYTKVSMDGSMYISERNIYRYPSAWNCDLKVSKSFKLSDWFGQSMGKSTIEFVVEVNNLFNRRQPLYVYANTDDPLDDGQGLNYTLQGMFSSTPWYKDATGANPASSSIEQYDNYGNRLYNANSDFDNNGIVTQEEKYQAYKNYYQDITIQSRSNYQAPISVRAGVVVKF